MPDQEEETVSEFITQQLANATVAAVIVATVMGLSLVVERIKGKRKN